MIAENTKLVDNKNTFPKFYTTSKSVQKQRNPKNSTLYIDSYKTTSSFVKDFFSYEPLQAKQLMIFCGKCCLKYFNIFFYIKCSPPSDRRGKVTTFIDFGLDRTKGERVLY